MTLTTPTVVKALGHRKDVMPRATFDQLLAAGWTVQGASLSQAWPPGNPRHPMVRMVQITAGQRMPMVFTPPRPTL